jgi:hypothetical protein
VFGSCGKLATCGKIYLSGGAGEGDPDAWRRSNEWWNSALLLVLILMYGVLDCTISLDLIISHLIMSRSSSSLVSLPEFGCCCESGPKELTLCCDLHLELPSAAWEISVGVGVGEKELGTTGTVMQNARFSLIAMRNTEK